jgi:hypothetical protein
MNGSDAKTLIENSENLDTTYLGTRESQMGVEENVGVTDDNRLLNVMNIGPIGHGKTQMMVHAALQDIHKGKGICLVTPKGDAIQQLLAKMPEDRLDDVIYVNPNEDPVTKINVLEPHIHDGMTRAQMENQREIIVSDVVDLFQRYSQEWGDRFGRVLKTLLRAHIDQNIHYNDSRTLVDVYDTVVDKEALVDLIDRTDNRFISNQLVRIKERLTDYELDPLQQRLDDFVMNDTVVRVVDTEESSVDFHDVVNNQKILLVDVQKGDIGSDAAQLVGSIVITQLWAASQARISMPEEERDPFLLYVDEVHNFAGEGSNFAKILAEAREYGLGLWLASQYMNQLEAEMRRSILNNCRNKIFFNPSGSEDVPKIVNMLQGVETQDLQGLGKFRAVMQQPSTDEYNGAVTFDTLPPWESDRDPQELEKIKVESTVADEEDEGELKRQWRQDFDRDGPQGKMVHTRLLNDAKSYLEKRPEVEQVNILHQEPGVDRPDGEVIKSNGSVANLEAECQTISKPAKILKNLKKAVENDRKCIFVVSDIDTDLLENVIEDPVNRLGDTHEDEEGTFDYYKVDGEEFTEIDGLADADYRILVATDDGTIRERGMVDDDGCPELNDNTEEELASFCLHREDGYCTALGKECVIDHE